MKLGLAVEGDSFKTLAAQALAAETAGIDIAWIPTASDGDTALLRAAGLAARTSVIRLAACVTIGGHPLEIAEAAAVADNCSNGRLILVLEDQAGDEALLAETVDVVLAALAPRPFRHQGARWTIPANLPENDQHEERIIVTPQAVQTELPVWLAGASAAEVARARGLAVVTAANADPDAGARSWALTESALGPAVQRVRRPALQDLVTDATGEFDADALVAGLREQQRAWGMDIAVMRPPADLDEAARASVAHRIATHVRPRVTLHELPAGLERHWQSVLT
jgi:alkanesulfonate monooxygenase SsuD/methylene tetrahydromethanopterin reductase-like flavin-dependent oxidoreductase (luciferase family)